MNGRIADAATGVGFGIGTCFGVFAQSIGGDGAGAGAVLTALAVIVVSWVRFERAVRDDD